MEPWIPFVYDTIKEIMPDVIVSDFWARAGCKAGDRLGIPTIINVPGPLEMIQMASLTKIPDMS